MTQGNFMRVIGGTDPAEARAARRLARARRINAEKHDRRVMLKIKLKDLAQEAKNIRREELLRKGGWLRLELYLHRVGHVRWEARAAQLAYAFLRGRSRTQVEPKRIPYPYDDEPPSRIYYMALPLFDRVNVLVKKYGPAGAKVPAEWFNEK